MDTLATFTPRSAQRRRLWEMVVGELRQAIILGKLTPGLRLEEQVLAEKFGVSRIPIRQALAQLEREGLVRIEHWRGAYVVGTTERDIHEVYACRMLIECHGIREAVNHVDLEAIARLQGFVDQMHRAIQKNQPELMAQPDISFHREIVMLAGNRRLLSFWDLHAGLVETMLSITDIASYNQSGAVQAHQRIVHSIEQRDADSAEELLRRHLQVGETVMRDALRRVRQGSAADEVLATETTTEWYSVG